MTRYVKARSGAYWHILLMRKGRAFMRCTGTPLAPGYTVRDDQPAFPQRVHDYDPSTLCMTCANRVRRACK